jgi:hypothetical protein
MSSVTRLSPLRHAAAPELSLLRDLPLQLLEPRRISGGVTDGVLNVVVPEIVLDQAGVRALVGESKAAGMAQHVGMHGHG